MVGTEKVEVFELWGGPYDGLTYEPATGKVSSVLDYVSEDGKTRPPLQGDHRVAYDSDSEILEVSGPVGPIAYDRVIKAGKSRWAYRKGSMR